MISLATVLVRSVRTISLSKFWSYKPYLPLRPSRSRSKMLGRYPPISLSSIICTTLYGSPKSVINPLFERIGINRLAEILHIRDFLGFFWRSGKSNMSGRGEIIEHLSPSRIFCGTSAMTLYQSPRDQRSLEKTVCMLFFFFISSKSLI